jgi:hypothetical protein
MATIGDKPTAPRRPSAGLRLVRLHEWRPPGHRRLKLQGGQTYMCRNCRAAMRVASSHYLPDVCAWCGASTWDEDGRCQAPIDCEATRRPESGTSAFCHLCGWSIWVPIPMRGHGGGDKAA